MIEDRLPGNLRGFKQRPSFIRNTVNPPMRPVAARIADGVLQVADDRVLPIDEIDRAVRPHLDVRGTEVPVIG